MQGRTIRRVPADQAARFAALYRAACADLALSNAYHLPPGTVAYLHQLVGRAHNQFYRTRTFDFRRWSQELFIRVPRLLYHDPYLRVAMLIFWGVFLLAAAQAYFHRGFADFVVGKEFLTKIEQDFSEPLESNVHINADERSGMAGFYIQHNGSIGLSCFGLGLLLGVGGLFETVQNAAALGAVFGHMATVPQRVNFFHFVTAHGPLELTAIVLSAAAGMRLGFSLVNTHGLSRRDSLHKAAREVMPVAGAALLMFILAALIEGFLSPSPAPYVVKAAVCLLTSGILVFYLVALGRGNAEY